MEKLEKDKDLDRHQNGKSAPDPGSGKATDLDPHLEHVLDA